MAGKEAANAPWQELEKQAYHAYREWHLWLVLRERELTHRSPNDRLSAGRTDKRSAGTAGAGASTEHQATSKKGNR